MNSIKFALLFIMIWVGSRVHCMVDITLSKATVDDLAELAKVHHASWQAEFAQMLSKEVVEKMDYEFCTSFWKHYFETGDPCKETYVAKVKDHIAGFVAIIKYDDLALGYDSEIDKIYVSPEYQGLKIGSRLINYALKILKKEGAEKTIVKVFIKNKGTQQFYEKLGGIYIKDADIPDYHSTIRVRMYAFDL